MVQPSGFDLATTAAPMLPVAPTLFSITPVFLSAAPSGSATMRATRSEAPPAENGTMILICGQGGASADAPALPSKTAAAATPTRIMTRLADNPRSNESISSALPWQAGRFRHDHR